MAERCTAKRKDGERCRAWAVLGGELCAGHAGLGIAADPVAMGRKGKAVQAERARERFMQAQERAQTLQEALAQRAAEERDALVDALFLAVREGTVQERQRAAQVVLERILGRPKEELSVETHERPPTLEELVAQWRSVQGSTQAEHPPA